MVLDAPRRDAAVRRCRATLLAGPHDEPCYRGRVLSSRKLSLSTCVCMCVCVKMFVICFLTVEIDLLVRAALVCIFPAQV